MRKLVALPVLSADALSSVAYGPEAMLAILVLGAGAGLSSSLPIAATIALLILAVGVSYRSGILGVLEIHEAVVESLIGDGLYRGHERAYAHSTARKSRRESNHHARMMQSSIQVLGRDVREVSDVLGEYSAAARYRRSEDLGVRASGQSKLMDGRSLNAHCTQCLSQHSGVHLIQQQPQCVSAAAVSRRCSSMRAATSSG
jgi:hypothetical protein